MSQSDNRYTEEHNPFQAPQTPFEPNEFAGADADVIRTQHLSHEASIKSIGGLYLIGGVLLVVMSFIVIVTRGNQQANWMTAIRLVFGVIGIVLCVLAFGIRRLRSWARIPAGIFSGLGLLGFEAAFARDYPVMFGTLFFFSLLGLLMSLVGDLMYTVIDPRIDFDSREG